MHVKAFSGLILSLLYLVVVLCENPFKSVVWDKEHKRFEVHYVVSWDTGQFFILRNSEIEITAPPYSFYYDQDTSTLTATEDKEEYSIKFDFESGWNSFDARALRMKILMGTGISVTVVLIIGALYYFLSAPAPSPIDAAKEKKAKLPKKEAKNGKLSKKGKASKVKDSKDEKLPKK